MHGLLNCGKLTTEVGDNLASLLFELCSCCEDLDGLEAKIFPLLPIKCWETGIPPCLTETIT